MPTNSNYDGYFTGIGDVSIFTYGMITITAVVLSYMTYMDTYIPDDISKPVLEATSMDGLIQSNPSETVGTIPPEVVESQLPQEPLEKEATMDEPTEEEPQDEPQDEPQEEPQDEQEPPDEQEPQDEPPNEQEETQPFPQDNEPEYEKRGQLFREDDENDDEEEDDDPARVKRQRGGKTNKKRITRKSKPSGKKH
jgi:hypothetical protein